MPNQTTNQARYDHLMEDGVLYLTPEESTSLQDWMDDCDIDLDDFRMSCKGGVVTVWAA